MPTRVIQGDRIGKQGRLRVGCSAVIFDPGREKILLTRRTDNGLWCLPGGGMAPGENAAEACVREVFEETGLQVQVIHLVGIYTSPDWLIEYPDGNRVQIIAMSFEVKISGGTMITTDEVSEFGFFSLAQVETLDLMQNHYQRLVDAFSWQKEAYIR